MTTRVDIRHRFELSEDAFWRDIFGSREFNESLYLRHLGFPGYEVQEQRVEPDGTLHRVVKTTPKADVPGAVKKVIGEGISYLEKGTFDPVAKRYRYVIETSRMSDKVRISGEMWMEPRGDDAADRCVHIEVEVKIFGVGKLVEAFIAKTLNDSYDKAAAFTNQWARDRGL